MQPAAMVAPLGICPVSCEGRLCHGCGLASWVTATSSPQAHCICDRPKCWLWEAAAPRVGGWVARMVATGLAGDVL